jgi:hypothetical protein
MVLGSAYIIPAISASEYGSLQTNPANARDVMICLRHTFEVSGVGALFGLTDISRPLFMIFGSKKRGRWWRAAAGDALARFFTNERKNARPNKVQPGMGICGEIQSTARECVEGAVIRALNSSSCAQCSHPAALCQESYHIIGYLHAGVQHCIIRPVFLFFRGGYGGGSYWSYEGKRCEAAA